MSIAPSLTLQAFTSESYAEGYRAVAWQDVLGAFGLRSISRPRQSSAHATALLRGSPETVLVARLAAGGQTVMPGAERPGNPVLLQLHDYGTLLQADGVKLSVPAGALVQLPRSGTWRLALPQGLYGVALSVRSNAGRRPVYVRRTGYGPCLRTA